MIPAEWITSPTDIAAEAALGVPYMTAERGIERLVEMGILREITGKARNRIYRADEILAVIEK